MGKVKLLLAIAGTLLVGQAGAAADAGRGEQLYKRTCQSCHATDPAARNVAGPRLLGVVGRRAGAVEGFRYTPAMSSSGITWSRENLDAYLANPRGKVPGTAMLISVANPTDRSDLLDYLETLK